MSNLTLDEKLIREHKAEPLEGHTVVVLERVGESGEKFHSLLEPGADRPRQGLISYLMGKPNVYFAYAVDATKGRSLIFTEHVEMAERAHGFDLQFSLWYRVSDPQLLVATRSSDPLERVRRKVAEVITEEVAELPWTDVWHAFRASSDAVVSATMTEIRNFSREYGISITSLRLRPTFSADATDPDREIHAAREKGRVARERMRVARDLQNERSSLSRENAERDEADRGYAAHRKLQDTVVNATTETLGRLITGAGSVSELRDVQVALGGVQGGAGLWGSGAHNGTGMLGNGHAQPQGAITAGGGGLPAVLSDLVTLTQQLDTEGRRRRVRGILLHLVATVVADDSTHVSNEQADYAIRARAEIDTATHLPVDRLEALQSLADPQLLRDRLYP
ncbi:hypothetical protein [Longimicrobium sp.]|uniref:hypothetical protein n=1 Tax=Longimicrobium sp. TaxID=2029185 RepID=UPI003B3A2A3E